VTSSFFENEILAILGTGARVLRPAKGTLSLAAATLSYRVVEKRFLRLKRRASVRTVPVVAAGR
jgi:peptidoglycan/LPS O-acetylase OafA/YrhL